MFKYIGYDLEDDTLIATNDESRWALTLGHAPQKAQYFSSLREACIWLKNNPNAHLDYLEDINNYIKWEEAQALGYMDDKNRCIFEDIEQEKAEAFYRFLEEEGLN